MKLSSCYSERLDCLGLRQANRLKSYVSGYNLYIEFSVIYAPIRVLSVYISTGLLQTFSYCDTLL
jgi:hypothetical protein